jgi:hypothetical protein
LACGLGKKSDDVVAIEAFCDQSGSSIIKMTASLDDMPTS